MKRARIITSSCGALAIALFLPKVVLPHASIYTHLLDPKTLDVIASVLKLGGQLVGAVYAFRVARRMERGNDARVPWFLLSGWQANYFVGQSILSTDRAMGLTSPVPSPGDFFFLMGYLSLLAATFGFVRAYRNSGFPLGSRWNDVAIATAMLAIAAVIGGFWAPIVLGYSATMAERIVNIAYPLFDLVVLIPTLILLRITSRFRGGRVWSVWAAILIALIFGALGDLLFAGPAWAQKHGLEPLVDLMFILSYLLAAWGSYLQYELLRE